MDDITWWWNGWIFLPALLVTTACMFLSNRYGRRWFEAGLIVIVPALIGSLIVNLLTAHTVISWIGTAVFAAVITALIVIVVRYFVRSRRQPATGTAESGAEA